MHVMIHQTSLELVQGYITELAVDAIVNPANSQLILGGGVAGAIRRKGGPVIQDECNRLAPIDVGCAVLTSGGKLAVKHVIHVVGPRMGEGDEDRKLKAATVSVLELADQNKLASVAFCAISTGIFGYPKDRCAKIMLAEIIAWLNGSTGLEKVFVSLYDGLAYEIFAGELTRQC